MCIQCDLDEHRYEPTLEQRIRAGYETFVDFAMVLDSLEIDCDQSTMDKCDIDTYNFIARYV